MTAAESSIYRDLMRFKPDGLSPNAWAVQAGVSRTVWTDIRRHGNPSRRTLEKLLAVVGSSLAEFEALRLGPERRPAGPAGQFGEAHRGWGSPPLSTLPLVASKLAGEWGAPGSAIDITEIRPGEILDRLQRPISLAADPDAFALTITGDSMWPRFRLGRKIAVSPNSDVAAGDDVLVRLRSMAPSRLDGAERVLIKQLVKKTAESIELRQFNPDVTFILDAGEFESVLKVVGELI